MSKLVEEWRDVVGYEGLYEVSDWGNVRSLGKEYIGKNQYGATFKIKKQGQLLKPVFDSDGYYIVSICGNPRKLKKVHRLVAEAWIPNPENKPIVGHLKTLENGLEDKTANEVWNLRWMTQEENSNYGTLPQRMSEITRSKSHNALKGVSRQEDVKKKISKARKKWWERKKREGYLESIERDNFGRFVKHKNK